MMSHKILPQNIITMDDVLPDATYYGLDLLLQHTPLLHTRPYSELSPVHVCTTAVLRLLTAGIGIDKYNEILNDDKYKYYLYVDLVSYLKKTEKIL